eukprot:TRINITY_DN10678_c0_g1_i2.p1 TRINITY_DN10678_c0_g1~~TRINITY_DN10678_c0_g1_i2.p1  ORF type:complete len:1907 (+),score=506.48 TRINITY_DN10678_c0_g1_i2:102-5822(+)
MGSRRHVADAPAELEIPPMKLPPKVWTRLDPQPRGRAFVPQGVASAGVTRGATHQQHSASRRSPSGPQAGSRSHVQTEGSTHIRQPSPPLFAHHRTGVAAPVPTSPGDSPRTPSPGSRPEDARAVKRQMRLHELQEQSLELDFEREKAVRLRRRLEEVESLAASEARADVVAPERGRLPADQLREIFEQLDANHDGVVTQEEFLASGFSPGVEVLAGADTRAMAETWPFERRRDDERRAELQQERELLKRRIKEIQNDQERSRLAAKAHTAALPQKAVAPSQDRPQPPRGAALVVAPALPALQQPSLGSRGRSYTPPQDMVLSQDDGQVDWRRASWAERHAARVARQEQERLTRSDLMLQREIAQKRLREFESWRRERAATVIQSGWRMYVAKKIAWLRREQKRSFKNQRLCMLSLQRDERRKKAEIEETRAAHKRDREMAIRKLQLLEARRPEEAAIKIQRMFRARKFRQALTEMVSRIRKKRQERKEAALDEYSLRRKAAYEAQGSKSAGAWQQHGLDRDREIARQRVEAIQEKMRTDAAKVIQRMLRKRLARKGLQQAIEASRRKKDEKREAFARGRAEEMRQQGLQKEKGDHALRVAEADAYRQAARARLKQLEDAKRFAAASKIQAAFRAKKSKRNVKNLIEAARAKERAKKAEAQRLKFERNQAEQDEAKRMLASKRAEEVAAIRQQAQQSYEAMERKRKEVAAAKIQGLFRSKKQRAAFAETITRLRAEKEQELDAARKRRMQQANMKKESEQAQLAKQRSAEIEQIKEAARQKAQMMEQRRRQNAATKIQGLFRSRQAKKGFWRLIEQKKSEAAQKAEEKRKAKVQQEEQRRLAQEEAKKKEIEENRVIARKKAEEMEHAKRERAAAKIQSAFRTKKAKSGFRQLLNRVRAERAAERDAAKSRRHEKELERLEEEKALLAAQRAAEWQATKEMAKRKAEEMESARRNAAAAKIQGLFRSKKAKKGFQALLERARAEKRAEKEAAKAKQWEKELKRLESQKAEQAAANAKAWEEAKAFGREKTLAMEEAKKNAAASKIQGAFRSKTARKGFLALLTKMRADKKAEQAELRAKKQEEQAQRLGAEKETMAAASASEMQDLLKQSRARVQELEEAKRNSAAKKIQGLFRTVKARKGFRKLLEQARAEKELKKANARAKQKEGELARLEREKAAVNEANQAAWAEAKEQAQRKWAEMEAAKKEGAATKIQGAFRTRKAKSGFAALIQRMRVEKQAELDAARAKRLEKDQQRLQERKAAEAEDEKQRRKAVEEDAKKKWKEYEENRRHQAAAVIQKNYRARNERSRFYDLVREMQRQARQLKEAKSKKRMTKLLAERQLEKARTMAEYKEALKAAGEAAVIRWHDMEEKRRQFAATKIQGAFRARQDRQGFMLVLNKLRYEHRERLAAARQKRREEAAARQASEQERVKHEKEEARKKAFEAASMLEQKKKEAAAMKIQGKFRAFQAQKGFAALLYTAKREKERRRMEAAQKRKEEQLQQRRREYQQDQEIIRAKLEEMERNKYDRAARKIQALFRGRKAKTGFNELLKEARKESEYRKRKKRLEFEDQQKWNSQRAGMQKRQARMASERRVREFEERQRNLAAARIQAARRGQLERRQVGALKERRQADKETERSLRQQEEARMRTMQRDWADPGVAKLQTLLTELKSIYLKTAGGSSRGYGARPFRRQDRDAYPGALSGATDLGGIATSTAGAGWVSQAVGPFGLDGAARAPLRETAVTVHRTYPPSPTSQIAGSPAASLGSPLSTDRGSPRSATYAHIMVLPDEDLMTRMADVQHFMHRAPASDGSIPVSHRVQELLGGSSSVKVTDLQSLAEQLVSEAERRAALDQKRALNEATEANAVFEQMDLNRDGVISQEEFLLARRAGLEQPRVLDIHSRYGYV